MKKKEALVLALLEAAALCLAFLVSGRLWFRLDLTGDKIYTISEVSRNIAREISDPVTITYFVSERLTTAHPLPGEIADLLREYAAHSRGKIRFTQKDPVKAELPGAVEELGILPRQIQVTERNETTLAMVYSGILIEYLDREAVIPAVFSPAALEYDLSSRIRQLIRNTGRELGVMAADFDKTWETDYALLNQELALSGFRVRPLNAGEEIPPHLPALFVLGGPEDLDERALSLIDGYIRSGGGVLFAVDGVFVDTRGGLLARPLRDRGLLAMLANYGVVVRQALAQDRAALNLTFESRNENGTEIHTMRYPQWIAVGETSGNPEHPVTANFGGLDLYWASPLELGPPPGVSADILFSTTEEAWLMTENFDTNPVSLPGPEQGNIEITGTRILGAALSGVFPAFSGDEQNPPGGESSRIIVVGDSDFAGPFMQASRGEERNLDFLIRSAAWLSGDEDLLSIRRREGNAARLDSVTDPEKRDRLMAFSRGVNMVLVPLGVIIAGLFLCRRRPGRRRRAVNEEGRPGDLG